MCDNMGEEFKLMERIQLHGILSMRSIATMRTFSKLLACGWVKQGSTIYVNDTVIQHAQITVAGRTVLRLHRRGIP